MHPTHERTVRTAFRADQLMKDLAGVARLSKLDPGGSNPAAAKRKKARLGTAVTHATALLSISVT
jgi:hypothetical protein